MYFSLKYSLHIFESLFVTMTLVFGVGFTIYKMSLLSSFLLFISSRLGRIKNHQLIVLYSLWGWEGRFNKISDNAPALMSVYFNVGPQIVLKYKVSYVMESWKWRNTFKTQSWKATTVFLTNHIYYKGSFIFCLFWNLEGDKRSKKCMR